MSDLEGGKAPVDGPAPPGPAPVASPRAGDLALPELASVEVGGMTREAFLVRSTLAAGAAYGLGAVAPFVRDALGADRTRIEARGDLNMLNFALTLEYVEQAVYREAAGGGGGGGRTGALIDKLAQDEAAHVAELRRLIAKFRGGAVAPPEVRFGGDARGEGLLALAQTIEDTVVFAAGGLGPNVESKELLERLGALFQVDARHAALLALARGEDPAPKAFEDTLSIPQVRERLSPYVPDFGG